MGSGVVVVRGLCHSSGGGGPPFGIQPAGKTGREENRDQKGNNPLIKRGEKEKEGRKVQRQKKQEDGSVVGRRGLRKV